ncbi:MULTISPECIES: winged helix DNA-binding domain-containing protein [Micromonospora]|uniref:Winged helix DNA-binding domain-containing protein n=1 Tax=Micromonospora solifontis TaxID=2487138 RepID=A0ABX9WEQ7_9ACTN|nr:MULTISPECIES: winged helix DNA-binding domain-containing protein [Micromonospora]NES16633.1 winged helix DNA-binding domain-containing protein [Micromonospora sp. PPF5-17B]NES38167.1 winged helix DNA-binding domain-containing protein [Micromonospora solifontis]NES56811.1 winged helix DNA-binding domain-containing protein [Micromonospora sp. PPF5-6]RNL96958.1 winged helix DNA-binding domain-containing protein [Micromonospora solifontis]
MVDPRQVMNFRVQAQQLGRAEGALDDTAVLDIGVQETGPDGGRWALAVRGVDVTALSGEDLILLWSVRGAPHLYRRAEVAAVSAALEPFSDADAGKRIYDAAKPLKAAGIGILAALDEVATHMRAVVTEPTVKGVVSARLAEALPEPYLRFCRPCNATHLYEMPFRLAAVRAGLELQLGTSPPVLRRIPRFTRAVASGDRFDLIRAYLRLLGPATPKHVADYLDAPVKEVRARWPEDVVEVTVDGERRSLLAADEPALESADGTATCLLGPFDLFLQAKDRATLVPDAAHAKELWPVLGRPGAVLIDGALVGTWRARKSGNRMTVTVQPWQRLSEHRRKAVVDQAERLAAYRAVVLAGVEFSG